MATMTLEEMWAHIRYLTLDRDSACSSDTLTDLINEAGNWWHTEYGDRVQRATGAADNLSYGVGGFTDVSQTIYSKILDASLTTDGSYTDGTPMDRVSPHDLYRMRLMSTANGTPRYWSAYRDTSVAGTWRVNVHPPSDTTSYYVSLMVETRWTDLSSGTPTGVPDVTPEDAYALCRIAAWQAAYLLGRDRQMIEAIKSMLPQHVKSRLGMLERSLAPRPPVEHVG